MNNPSIQAERPRGIILDSSVLFRIPRAEPVEPGAKEVRYMPAGEYVLDFYNSMCEMVAEGRLTFPIEVKRESEKQQKEDPERNYDLALAFTQKAWDVNWPELRVPSEEQVGKVVNLAFTRDVALERERKADPYVIAIALTLRGRGLEWSVATEDKKMIKCCGVLGIRVLNTREFIDSVLSWRAPPRS